MSTPVRRPLTEDQSWVLEPLLQLPHVRHAAVVSSDGFVQGRSPELSRESAEGVAAMLSALQGAARTTTSAFTGGSAELRQTVIESAQGWLVAVPAGANACLVVFAAPEINMGVLAHRMHVQVAALGAKAMSSKPRQNAAT
ncbi:roadblock/LC7 domain-containing protein [Streptomyces sp. NPDC004647]|uniref:roadblock/LC7 domain-containing protein n=1 Tax=Streptomyces sp. NPDC004647 TaxID=3154671 RepID=UPI0033B26174